MAWTILLLANRVAPGPLDPATAFFSLCLSLVFTAGLAWFADRHAHERARRRRAELAAAVPVGGVH